MCPALRRPMRLRTSSQCNKCVNKNISSSAERLSSFSATKICVAQCKNAYWSSRDTRGAESCDCPNKFLENLGRRYSHVVARSLLESSSLQYKHVVFQSIHGIGGDVNRVLRP